ncbi:EAL domain-containing protein [Curvibacter sp. CHRR-16]|uniref:putative bifunctional diguanylate cyclase/phosphodiesterase n=1 Tax=Curvibacter sp. CHRR-16 TaxID=2835872 RepID=UPI001BD9DAB6|nr:bifunctional diguanylate cyclase/phosphodiesterase [Curvibacter sp. CHRR-16]MBT0571392.1 EAL domain-containing protein [Curvibacter sp. CHRR-16]
MQEHHWAEQLLRSHPDGIALMNDAYVLQFVNQHYLEIWGFTEQSAYGMTPSERFAYQADLLANPQEDAFALRLLKLGLDEPKSRYFKLKDGRWLERIAYRFMPLGSCTGIVSQWRDVTGKYLQDMATQYERDLMHSMMDSVPDQIFFKDLKSRFIRINASLAKRYGLDRPEQAVGKSDADFYSAEHAAQTRREELEIMRTGTPIFNQLHHEVWNDGTEAWNVSMKMPLRDATGKTIGIYGVAHDITEHKKAEALIWQQANFDALTGLPNRRMLRDRWEQAVKSHKRSGHGLALLILDLDHFKEVNDNLGHAVGDQLLVAASKRIGACLRASDTLARMGGDEFAIILTDQVSDTYVGDIVHKIVSCMDDAFDLSGQCIFVSVSVGVTLYPQNGESFDELLKLSDQAMYEAKEQGRNRFCFFTQALQERSSNRLRMAHDLHIAVREQQFHLVYQPIVDLRSGAIHKAEALIRWNHPQQGAIPPSEFIPLAESIGLIEEIGEWVFRTAAQTVRQWRSEVDPLMQISVNKSPLQFQRKVPQGADWVEYLHSINLAPDAIVVEITEGLLLDASEWVRQQLQTTRQSGLRLSLDDFGTGYSSLSYLHRYDIDFLKIDQSFMRELRPGSKTETLCKAIIRMGHELGIQIIAEGIENSVQRDLLVEADCDFAQGYFFAKPMLPDEFLEFIRKTA